MRTIITIKENDIVIKEIGRIPLDNVGVIIDEYAISGTAAVTMLRHMVEQQSYGLCLRTCEICEAAKQKFESTSGA